MFLESNEVMGAYVHVTYVMTYVMAVLTLGILGQRRKLKKRA